MALPPFVYVVVVFVALVIIALLILCVLACLGVCWCCKLTKKPSKKPYAVPPGFSLQRLETIRIDPPEQKARIAAENAFLDALPGLPPRYPISLFTLHNLTTLLKYLPLIPTWAWFENSVCEVIERQFETHLRIYVLDTIWTNFEFSKLLSIGVYFRKKTMFYCCWVRMKCINWV